MSELTDQEIIAKYKKDKKKRLEYATKRRIKLELIYQKAVKAGIKVTDAEIKAEIKKRELDQ